MSLPRLARRIELVAERRTWDPLTPDEWNRPAVQPPSIVATWRGDLQPKRVGPQEVETSNDAGPVVKEYVVYADPGLDVREADTIRRAVDDGLRYRIGRVRRVGEGMRLEHLQCDVVLVTRGTP